MLLRIVTINFKVVLVRKELVRKYLKHELLWTSEHIRAWRKEVIFALMLDV